MECNTQGSSSPSLNELQGQPNANADLIQSHSAVLGGRQHPYQNGQMSTHLEHLPKVKTKKLGTKQDRLNWTITGQMKSLKRQKG